MQHRILHVFMNGAMTFAVAVPAIPLNAQVLIPPVYEPPPPPGPLARFSDAEARNREEALASRVDLASRLYTLQTTVLPRHCPSSTKGVDARRRKECDRSDARRFLEAALAERIRVMSELRVRLADGDGRRANAIIDQDRAALDILRRTPPG